MQGAVEVYRGVAEAWECDIMGHLNVQFYTAKAAAGLGHLWAAAGLGPAALRRERLAVDLERSLIHYRRELRAGEILSIDAALARVDASEAQVLAVARNAESGEVAASYALDCRLVVPDTGAAVAWPEPVRARLEAMRTTEPPPAPRRGTGAPTVAPAGGFAQPFTSARGSVMAWMCDASGRMAPRFFIAFASDAVGHVKAKVGLDRRTSAARNWGSAALEYEVRVLRPLRAGDLVSMRSGLLGAGRKTVRFGHLLVDDESGAVCASYDVVACLFDLKRRRALELPAAVRAAAERQLIAWPPDTDAPVAP